MHTELKRNINVCQVCLFVVFEGNDNLHLLTAGKRCRLRVELTAFDGSTGYAEFDNFTVASAADKYRLSSIGRYSGTAGKLTKQWRTFCKRFTAI